jgi:hypothetical protein
VTLGTEHFRAFTSCDECHFWLTQSEVLQFSGGSIVATVKMTYALLALALTFTTGMAVVTVIAYTDQAMAFTTVITHEDQAVGGCSGSGC